MSEKQIIPLFPLTIVVFPGQSLPLHIFEARYRQLLSECRQAQAAGGDLPIGICLGQDSDVHAQAGCTVVLERVLNEYEDGQLDIITAARQRFRILEIFAEKAYLTAAVAFFEDEPGPVEEALLERAQIGHRRLMELVEEETGAALDEVVPTHSFQIAQSSGMDLETRQRLLEMTSENERLQALDEYFERLIPELEQRRQEKRRVRSNGHARKI